ncbi:30S ribosomal protein S17 [Verrucomicrobiota bacterium]
MSETAARGRGVRKRRTGVVVSKSGDKSIVVLVERHKRHELYGKVIRSTRKYHAHDPENTAKPGDRVRIVETRPLSKNKRWRLVEVVASA